MLSKRSSNVHQHFTNKFVNPSFFTKISSWSASKRVERNVASLDPRGAGLECLAGAVGHAPGHRRGPDEVAVLAGNVMNSWPTESL